VRTALKSIDFHENTDKNKLAPSLRRDTRNRITELSQLLLYGLECFALLKSDVKSIDFADELFNETF